MSIRIDHVGWTTNNIELFEAFWCDILGYREIYRTTNGPEVMMPLHGRSDVEIRRYALEKAGLVLEIHYFPDGSPLGYPGFHRVGLDHVCIYVGNRGSREPFLEGLPEGVEVKKVSNPKGWETVFIKDFEGNLIEVREDWTD